MDNYGDDYHYLLESLLPRVARIEGKNYDLITEPQIRKLFKYFFVEAKGSKCDDFYNQFFQTYIIDNNILISFFEDKKEGLQETRFIRNAGKFKGQETNDISEFISKLYFCRESFLESVNLTPLFIENGSLTGGSKKLHLKILDKIGQVRRTYTEFIYDVIELKSIANGEEFCKPFYWNDEKEDVPIESLNVFSAGFANKKLKIGRRDNFDTTEKLAWKHLIEKINGQFQELIFEENTDAKDKRIAYAKLFKNELSKVRPKSKINDFKQNKLVTILRTYYKKVGINPIKKLLYEYSTTLIKKVK